MEQLRAAAPGRAAPCLPSWESEEEKKHLAKSTESVGTSLGKRRISLVWFEFFFFSNEKGSFSPRFHSSPSSRLIKM